LHSRRISCGAEAGLETRRLERDEDGTFPRRPKTGSRMNTETLQGLIGATVCVGAENPCKLGARREPRLPFFPRRLLRAWREATPEYDRTVSQIHVRKARCGATARYGWAVRTELCASVTQPSLVVGDRNALESNRETERNAVGCGGRRSIPPLRSRRTLRGPHFLPAGPKSAFSDCTRGVVPASTGALRRSWWCLRGLRDRGPRSGEAHH
jgi:hypothetical protein